MDGTLAYRGRAGAGEFGVGVAAPPPRAGGPPPEAAGQTDGRSTATAGFGRLDGCTKLMEPKTNGGMPVNAAYRQ